MLNTDPGEIADRLNNIRHLVECVWMAATDLEPEQTNALQALLDHVSSELKDLGDDILQRLPESEKNDAEGEDND